MIVYRELSSLVYDLGFSSKSLYSVSNNIKRHYHRAEIPKKNGEYRTLYVPDEHLKSIQRSINRTLLAYMEIAPYATAYRPSSSTVVNAMPHIGQSVLLKLDIRHFFDSILFSVVKDRVFPSTRFSEPNRVLLTCLCMYNDVLPQGAPTSPAISNIIMRDFDDTVGNWCKTIGIRYTRYCDDMAFSGVFSPSAVIEFVRRHLRNEGFFLNDKKTVILKTGQRKTVTGIVVNEKPSVPAAYRKKLRQEIYYCIKFGVQSHTEKTGIVTDEKSFFNKLMGRVNYVLSVNPVDAEMLEYKNLLAVEIKKLD